MSGISEANNPTYLVQKCHLLRFCQDFDAILITPLKKVSTCERKMKAASTVIFSVIWLIIVMMVGFIITTNLIANANASGNINGTAATHWNTFVTMIWISFGILALSPLVLTALMFMGLFGGLGGRP